MSLSVGDASGRRPLSWPAQASRTPVSESTSQITRIGVVTPSLNGETYLKQTLESIWSQESETLSIDHVLVDGGSTDRTLEIASGYPTRTVVSPDDRGMYDAVNRGMSLVEGDILGYIN